MCGDSCATARQFVEFGRLQDHMAGFGQSLKLEGTNNALRGCHIVIYAVEPKFISVLIFLYKAPPSAADRLKRFKGRVQVARSQPADVNLGVGMSFEYQFTRRIKLTGNEKFLLSGLRRNRCLIF